MATTEPSPKASSRRKRRWGDGPDGGGDDGGEGGGGVGPDSASPRNNRKGRFSDGPPPHQTAAAGPTNGSGNGAEGGGGAAAPSDPKARAAALQASIQARLAALKARTAAGGGGAGAGGGAAAARPRLPPPPPPAAATAPPTVRSTDAGAAAAASGQKRPLENSAADGRGGGGVASSSKGGTAKRAKVFELDMSSTAPTRLLEKREREERLRTTAAAEIGNKAPEAPGEKVNPYLAHTVEASAPAVQTSKSGKQGGQKTTRQSKEEGGEVLLDTRLAPTQKARQRSRPMNFVEPGTYIALGEKKREQASRAEASGYVSGRKVGNVVRSVGMVGVGGVVEDDDGGGAGGGAAALEAASGAGYYGSSEAGRALRSSYLPPRADAPEVSLEDHAPKKRVLTGVSDVRLEENDGVVSSALRASVTTSGVPYAMEWWDAELLPGKLRKELAGEEGRAIADRARKKQGQQLGGGGGGGGAKDGEKDDGGDGGEDADDPTTSAAARRHRSRDEAHSALIAKCYKHASLSHSKTHSLVQHPVPVLTPAQRAAREAARNKPPTLHLTKAERKRHRKLRRAERLREQQDLQAAGLVPPPEPRLTLSNYMKVLGDQAVLDPSRMEAVVMEQIQSRKLKHEKMNAERKLTKEQRSEKRQRKLHEDTSQSVCVALFYVKDMGHPYHRAKVDLNAQQNGITGGVLECSSHEGGGDGGGEGMALVVAEGGEKAIKRYTRLMTVRMRWRGEDFYEEDDEDDEEEDLMVGEDDDDEGGEDGEGGEGGGKRKREKRRKFNPNNECELIWTGMSTKRAFHSFMFQSAEGPVAARRILEAKGVAHYWDLAAGHHEEKRNRVASAGGGAAAGGDLKFRLG